MKKIFFALYIVFALLTFIGIGYVLYNKGQVSAGYSFIPMIFAITFSALYRAQDKVKENKTSPTIVIATVIISFILVSAIVAYVLIGR